MEAIIASISGGLVLLAAIFRWRCRRVDGRNHQSAELGRLEEAARSEELSKGACLASPDGLQSRLETMPNQASSAEPMQSDFIEPAQYARNERFEAAALLLAAGHSAERVSAVLALPISEVELVLQLQKWALHGRPVTAPRQAAPTGKNPPRREKKKLPNRQGRQKVRPILLTEVVRFDGANGAKSEAAA